MTILKPKSQTSRPTLPPNSLIFPNLPPEIRSLIYGYAFPPTLPLSTRQIDYTPAADTYGHSRAFPNFLPSLCRLNGTMRIDIALWLLRSSTIGILYTHDIVYFKQFLHTLPGTQGFESIRRLDFQLFGKQKTSIDEDGKRKKNSFVQFMKTCPDLTGVTLKFEMWNLLKDKVKLGLYVPGDFEDLSATMNFCTVEELVDMYGLADMLELESLTSFTVEVWPKIIAASANGVVCGVLNYWALIEELLEWFRKGFEERGRKVDVRLVESKSPGLRCVARGIEYI